MITRLLVGLDGSPLAELVLPYVETFARAANAQVTLVRVITPETEAERNERHEAEHYLDRIVQALGERGIVAEGKVIPGHPAKVLVEETQDQTASLILLCTHGRSGLGKLVYGSVAEAVVAQSAVPVLLVRAWKPAPDSAISPGSAPILVPLDGTPTAERALPIAAELATLLAAKLKLVEVVPPVDGGSATERWWLMGEPEKIQREEQSKADKYLASHVDRLQANGLATTRSVRLAPVGDGIASEAAAIGAGLIVMATQADSPLAQILVRSVAIEVLHRVGLALLLIGPRVALG